MRLPAALDHRGRRVVLKYHKLNTGRGQHAPNGLAALDAVLEGGAEAIEFDVGPLGDGAFALLHDDRLERETDGVGPVRAIDRGRLSRLRLRGTDERPATLAEAAERLRAHDRPLKVQVDLKQAEPFAAGEAGRLLDALAPLRSHAPLRVVVGCLADWNLRALRRLDRDLLVGFDPAFYLHAPDAGPLMPLPTRVNAFGYVDDHPLGYRRAMPVAAYLEDRLESLVEQVPGAVEYYLHWAFVLRALDDGFDPVAYLHGRGGALVDVWTLNHGDEGLAATLERVLGAEVDQITTDTAVQLAEALARS